MPSRPTNRRDFLTGRAVAGQLAAVGDEIADELRRTKAPSRGPSLVLQTTAMACHFDAILNPDGPPHQVEAASRALDEVHRLEEQMTVYRPTSALSRINATASTGPVAVEPNLYALLIEARRLCETTGGAFDPTSGPLIQCWRNARSLGRIPTDDELRRALAVTGIGHVGFDDAKQTLAYDHPNVELNLGAIGKGHAVDRMAEILAADGIESFLVHGGKSSVRAAGGHAGHDGWPVGIRDPLLPEKLWCTVLLKDAALSTSGTAVQAFRHQGKRYGHILDPRTGWPAEGVVSVSVIAPTAAEADALSTAFFVMGLEKTRAYCDNSTHLGVLLFPTPTHGRRLEPVILGIPPERMFFTSDLAETTDPA